MVGGGWWVTGESRRRDRRRDVRMNEAGCELAKREYEGSEGGGVFKK